MSKTNTTPQKGVPCCPEVNNEPSCNILDFVYRLGHRVSVNNRNHEVEVSFHIRYEICRGPLELGNLSYSTTLLPGEKVRLFTMDRRSRFSFDTESSLSYRHVQAHEEQYYMSAISKSLSDITVSDQAISRSRFQSEFEQSGSSSGAIASLFSGKSVRSRGTYDAASTSTFLRELRRHAETSHQSAVQATRASSSVSVGEVQSRTHAEGETESHFESSSRMFSNPNKCHAVTYYFYQLNQKQTIKFYIKSVQRRIIRRNADTLVAKLPTPNPARLSVIPTSILATNPERLQLENREIESNVSSPELAQSFQNQLSFPVAADLDLNEEEQKAVLDTIDQQLISAGILDRQSKELSSSLEKSFRLELTTSLPTPGLLVKGCLDDCNICEPELLAEVKVDLERKKLENELLKRKIELLDKAQEYRCCPIKEEEKEERD